MKIIAQTEVSSSPFMTQNENGQASTDFFFLLFLQLIQTAIDILNTPKEPTSNFDGMNSQDTKPNYQRALNFIDDNPSLKETFNQAITFISLLSQFIYNKEKTFQETGQDEGVIAVKVSPNVLPNQLLRAQNLSLYTDEERGKNQLLNQLANSTNESQFKTLLLSQDTMESLSSFISKAWKEYKALLKSIKEEANLNSQYVKDEFSIKINAEWENLPTQAKNYLKEVLTNPFTNFTPQGKKTWFISHNSDLNGQGLQDLAAEKNTQLGGEFQVKTIGGKGKAEENFQIVKGVERKEIIGADKNLNQEIEPKQGFIPKIILDEQGKLEKVKAILRQEIEEVEPKGSEKENPLVFPTHLKEELNSLALNTSKKVQPNTLFRHKVALEELPNFVRNIVIEVWPQGEHVARLELFPPELGQVELEVKVQNGEVSVVGKLENSQAYQDVLKEAPVIKTHLEELGLKVKELVFTLTSGDANLPYHGDRQPKENKEGLSVKNNGRLLTQGLPKEETLINTKGRYYYIV